MIIQLDGPAPGKDDLVVDLEDEDISDVVVGDTVQLPEEYDDLLGEEEGEGVMVSDIITVDDAVIPGTDIEFEPSEDEEEEERSWEKDGDHVYFMPYLRQRLNEIPKHRGDTTVGCERVVAYLRRLDKEITKAIHTDEKNILDEDALEQVRDKLYADVDRLEDRIEQLKNKKRKKKASFQVDDKVFARIARDGIPEFYIKVASEEEGESLLPVEIIEPDSNVVTAYMEYERDGLKKEASSAKIMLTVDPFLNEISRMIIKAHVTYGRNVEDVYKQFAKKYDFTDRDHLAVHGLLREKGLLQDKDFSRIDEEIMTGDSGITTKIYPA